MADLSFYDDTARKAAFLASKVSAEVFDIDTLRGQLERGEYKIGGGATKKKLESLGFPKVGTPLGPNSVITDNHVGLHDRTLGNWREGFSRYGALTKYGAIILCGTVENFSKWAQSQPCLDEVKTVAEGRLFAYIDGYILSISLKSGKASATVNDGQGKIVYARGDYYVGGIKGGKQHGQGRYTFAGGDTYVGPWVDGNMHGQGTFTWKSGDKYVGPFVDDKKHGQGTFTNAKTGEVKKGVWENNKRTKWL